MEVAAFTANADKAAVFTVPTAIAVTGGFGGGTLSIKACDELGQAANAVEIESLTAADVVVVDIPGDYTLVFSLSGSTSPTLSVRSTALSPRTKTL